MKPFDLNKKILLSLRSGGELLKMRLLDSHLLDTFGSKSIARHEIDKLLESSKSWINLIRTDDQNIVICSNPVFI
jgi:hypothetical protein